VAAAGRQKGGKRLTRKVERRKKTVVKGEHSRKKALTSKM